MTDTHLIAKIGFNFSQMSVVFDYNSTLRVLTATVEGISTAIHVKATDPNLADDGNDLYERAWMEQTLFIRKLEKNIEYGAQFQTGLRRGTAVTNDPLSDSADPEFELDSRLIKISVCRIHVTCENTEANREGLAAELRKVMEPVRWKCRFSAFYDDILATKVAAQKEDNEDWMKWS